jgi:Na+/H+-dicarboxylate symporter
MDKQRMTTEEIEVRVWAWIVMILASILFMSVVGIILGVMFVEHDMERISPIDQAFLGILKDIMLLCIGAVGGIVGRKGAYAAANLVNKKEEKKDDPAPSAV